MEKLIIEKTDCTPSVVLNKEEGIFEITGKSMPENAVEFYEPVIEWIENYLKNPNAETILKLDFLYFNTASAKIYFDIFHRLDDAFLKGINIKVNWCYFDDDEDLQEAGEDFAEMTKVPFVFSVLTE